MDTIFDLYECTHITFILFLCASLPAVIMGSLTNEKDAEKWQRNQKKAVHAEDLEVNSYD